MRSHLIWFFIMSPSTRRVLQALLYEAIAIAVVGPVLSLAFDKSPTSTFGLAVVLSTVALTWNYVFNWIFERWESRQSVRGRSFARRLAHGAGFEGGLVILLLPVMSLWLDISLLTAFLANLGLLVFFFFYAIAFTWCFDRVFGLPASARAGDADRA
ncbi:MAG: PACE efflux transporter [Limnohabitans sp.]